MVGKQRHSLPERAVGTLQTLGPPFKNHLLSLPDLHLGGALPVNPVPSQWVGWWQRRLESDGKATTCSFWRGVAHFWK